MINVWKCLGKSTLIRLIGEDNLNFAENILPDIAREFGKDPEDYLDIVSKQSKLAELFSVSAMSEAITKKDFRKELLDYLSPEYREKLQKAFKKFDNYDSLVKHICSKPWTRNPAVETFCDCLDIPIDIVPETRDVIPDFETLQHPQNITPPFKQLKSYQMRTVANATEELESPRSRFMLQMPTGSGKTRVAMEIVCNVLTKYSEEERNKVFKSKDGINVIWLANREELLEQAYMCFREVWSHLSNQDINIIRFFGGKAKNYFKRS